MGYGITQLNRLIWEMFRRSLDPGCDAWRGAASRTKTQLKTLLSVCVCVCNHSGCWGQTLTQATTTTIRPLSTRDAVSKGGVCVCVCVCVWVINCNYPDGKTAEGSTRHLPAGCQLCAQIKNAHSVPWMGVTHRIARGGQLLFLFPETEDWRTGHRRSEPAHSFMRTHSELCVCVCVCVCFGAVEKRLLSKKRFKPFLEVTHLNIVWYI